MQFIRQNTIYLLAGLTFIVLSSYFIWQGQAHYSIFPVVLMAIYCAIYYTEVSFLSLAFFTPLSINIEEYTDSFGLFIPTEPMLFGFMLLFFMLQLRRPIVDKALWRHPIVLCVALYLIWIFLTSITSSHPLVSFKYLLSRLWFIVPLLLMGTYVFREQKSIRLFFWLFIIGMIIVILYTLIIHASYRFGEKESHWVMWPFFKDHTIYGAIVALILPLCIGLYKSKKHSPLLQAIIIGFIFINLLGLYFSYTRAAWLSIVAALAVWALIHFKIKFSIIGSIGILSAIVLFTSWDTIQMELERNKYEHTTEEFGERLQSATNVSTDASNLERINRWSCALAMFEERPLMGFGPGTYAFEYARFQQPENLTIISTNFGDMGNSHSEYLGPLAEMGLLGFILMLCVVAAIFFKGITLYNNWPASDSENKVWILSIVLSLTTYFVHGILNNFLDTDKAAVPIWGMCAIIIALEIRLKTTEK